MQHLESKAKITFSEDTEKMEVSCGESSVEKTQKAISAASSGGGGGGAAGPGGGGGGGGGGAR